MNSIDPLIALDPAHTTGGEPSDVRRRAWRFAAGSFVFALLVGAWLFWRRHLPLPAVGVALLGLSLLGLAAVKPEAVLTVRAFWLRVARYVGTFNTFVILSLLYFVAVVPIGLVARLVGRDRLGLRRQPSATSYWRPRAVQRDKTHFERPY